MGALIYVLLFLDRADAVKEMEDEKEGESGENGELL